MYRSLPLVCLALFSMLSASILGDGTFWASGDATLWRLLTTSSYYTIIGPSPASTNGDGPKGNQVAYSPSYEWGYRIELGYRWCCCDLRVNWASLNTTYKRSALAGAGEAAWPTLWAIGAAFTVDAVNQGLARYTDSYNADVLNGEFSLWKSLRECRLDRRLFAGVQYMRINNRATYTVSDPNEQIFRFNQQNSDFQGTGPRFGGELTYRICKGLNLRGLAASSLLLTSTKGFLLSKDPTVSPSTRNLFLVRNQSWRGVSQSLEMQFGIDACCQYGRALFHAGLGYEITRFWDAKLENFYPGGQINNKTMTRPVSITGWYFRLGGGF